MPTRDVPISYARAALEDRLRSSMAANSEEGVPSPADEASLQSFVSMFDGELTVFIPIVV